MYAEKNAMVQFRLKLNMFPAIMKLDMAIKFK